MSIVRVPQIGSATAARSAARRPADGAKPAAPPTRVTARPRDNARQPLVPPGLHAPVMAQIIAFTLDERLGGRQNAPATTAGRAYGETQSKIIEARRVEGDSWTA